MPVSYYYQCLSIIFFFIFLSTYRRHRLFWSSRESTSMKLYFVVVAFPICCPILCSVVFVWKFIVCCAQQDITYLPKIVIYGSGNSGDCSSDSESEDRPVGLSCLVRIDNWVQFLGDPQAAHLALQLRHKLHALILRRLRAPNKPLTQVRTCCLARIYNWVQFLVNPQAAHLALELRHNLHILILRRLNSPNKPLTQVRTWK